MLTKVLNACTGEFIPFTCGPKNAVIAAHAQSLKDFNTDLYEERYGHLVVTGEKTVGCGDFIAFTHKAKVQFLNQKNIQAANLSRKSGRKVSYDYAAGHFVAPVATADNLFSP